MEWMVAIVVGAAVGLLAYGLSGSPPVPCVLLGIVGAVVGDRVAAGLGLAAYGTARWLASAIGAGLLIAVVRALGGLRPPLRSA